MININKKIKTYILGALLGLLGGVILYFVQPVQWKAEALIKIGQFNHSYTIEPMNTVQERLKSKSFYLAVAKISNNYGVENLLDVDKGSGISVKPIKLSDTLKVSVVGGSLELVKASIDSVVVVLIAKHDAILNAYQAEFREELSKINLEIADLKKHIALLTLNKAENEKSISTGFQFMSIEHDLDYKLNRASQLRDLISSINIRPTSLLDLPSLSKELLFSKLWRACLFGVLVGIFLSLLWVHGLGRNKIDEVC